MLAAVRDGHAVHHRLDALPAFFGRRAHVEKGQLDVFIDVEFVDEVETLEHETYDTLADVRAVVLPEGAHIVAVQQVGAFGGIVEQAQDVEQGGLSAARRPHYGHKLARLHFEVHFTERPCLHFFRTEYFLDVL